MILLTFFHFPRYLVFDLPVVASVMGGIFVIGAVFPVQLGTAYSPGNGQLTIPEWYLTSLYALLRTELDKFTMAGLIPVLWLLMFAVVPFVDTSKKMSWKERPFFAALGITSIGEVLVTTSWGAYVNPDTSLSTLAAALRPPDRVLRVDARAGRGQLRAHLLGDQLPQRKGEGEEGAPAVPTSPSSQGSG